MNKAEFARKIEKSGFCFQDSVINRKVTANNDSNTTNDLNLPQSERKDKSNFFEMFKGTEYLARNNCTYFVSFRDNKKTEKLLCNFVAWIDEEITVDDGLEGNGLKRLINFILTVDKDKDILQTFVSNRGLIR